MRRTQLEILQSKLDGLPIPYAPLTVIKSNHPTHYHVVQPDGTYFCGANTLAGLRSILWKSGFHNQAGINYFY